MPKKVAPTLVDDETTTTTTTTTAAAWDDLEEYARTVAGATAKPPKLEEPKPGEPEYDWTPHYDTPNLYRHTFKDGTVVAIRSMQAIQNRTWMYKMRDVKSDDQFIVKAISRASCVVADGVLMRLDDTHGDPIDELWAGWLAAGTGNGDGGLSAGN
jgi:hypothetical protein